LPEFYEVELFGEEVVGEEVVGEEVVGEEVAVCDIVADEEVVSEDGELLIDEEIVDPSLMFYSLMTCEGGDPEVAVCDGLLIEEEPVFKGDGEEEVVIDGEEPVEVTIEDFDPSWVKRSFGVPSGEVVYDLAFTCGVVDEEVVLDDVVDEEFAVDEEFVDVTTLEGYDPSWAYRGTVVDGEEVVVDEEVVGEEGEVIEEDPVVFLDYFIVENGLEIPWRNYFGMNFRDNSLGELPVEIPAMTTGMPGAPGVESTSSVMGPVAPATPIAAPAVNVPVVNQPVSLPVGVTPALAIPVNSSGFAPLFAEEEELLVSTLAPVVSEIEPLVSEVEVTVSSGLDSEFGDFIGSSSDSSDAAVGELTPIFDDEEDEEESAEVPAAEDAPVETEESVSSVDVPQQPVVVASRANYGRSIDEFMSEFAMSGFAG
jgi:hypothetical protein